MREIVLKITHIASGDLWAGAEAQLLTLCKSLNSAKELSIEVILLNNGELANRLKYYDIEVLIINEQKYNSYQIFKKIKKHLLTSQSQLVHTHRKKENIIGGLAAKYVGIPSMRTVHGDIEITHAWKKPHKLLINYLNWLIGRFIQNKLIAVSHELRKVLIEYYPESKVATIENGVDIDSILNNAKMTLPSYNTERLKIAIVGRLVQVKRVDIFLNIAKYCTDNLPYLNAEFFIFGDGPLMDKLKESCSKMGIDSVVHFQGHTSNIHASIAQMDILLITSDHEGLPMTLLEAMTLGTPVIAHSVGGITKALKEGNAGILIESNITENYVAAIERYIDDQLFITKILSNAKAEIKDNYSSELNASHYLNEYKSLL